MEVALKAHKSGLNAAAREQVDLTSFMLHEQRRYLDRHLLRPIDFSDCIRDSKCYCPS